MNFITDNYIWFIISGGSLLLITMGYYADKTGFGKYKFGEKHDKTDGSNNEQPVIINMPINEALANHNITTNNTNNVNNINTNNNVNNITNTNSNSITVNQNVQKNDSISEINMNLSNDATNVSNSVGVPEVNILNSGTSSEPVNSPVQGTDFDLLKDNEDVWKF